MTIPETPTARSALPVDSGKARAYAFGDFVLDSPHATLLRGGLEVPLRPKCFDVLRYLVEHPDQLVTRAELLTAIWGRTVVTDDAITQCLINIRKAINDVSHEAIRTVPRRGYIFTLPVSDYSVSHSTPKSDAVRRNHRSLFVPLVLGLFLVAVASLEIARFSGRGVLAATTSSLAAPNSIAVLPFIAYGNGGESEFFPEGVSEEIRGLLAQCPDLQVLAQSSSLSFYGHQADALKVAWIVEGSVGWSGERMHVTAQLVQTSSGTLAWSKVYDRETGDALAAQSAIASAVVGAVQSELSTRSE